MSEASINNVVSHTKIISNILIWERNYFKRGSGPSLLLLRYIKIGRTVPSTVEIQPNPPQNQFFIIKSGVECKFKFL